MTQDGSTTSRRENRTLHKRYYATSALRTLAFYGSVVTLGFFFHTLVVLVIAVFFLRFYRGELRAFLRAPLRSLRGDRFPEGYRFETMPPFSLGKGPAGASASRRP